MEYREIIYAEFSRRRSQNRFYSLRKFAIDLGISKSHLSNILNSKRGLSPELARTIVGKLSLQKGMNHRAFVLLVTKQSARASYKRGLAAQALSRTYMKNAQIELHSLVRSQKPL